MIAEMMAEHLAASIAALSAVRPVMASAKDAYPFVTYETIEMRNKRYLNCISAQYEGAVRFNIAGANYAQVSTICEQVKDLILPFQYTGEVYRIRLCKLRDESDVVQQQDDDDRLFYVKSVDFEVKAIKL